MVVLYILLFILCLSVLIAVHEAGHLAAAKIFKVYCFEYAIGFGPKIFSKKRKNGFAMCQLPKWTCIYCYHIGLHSLNFRCQDYACF